MVNIGTDSPNLHLLKNAGKMSPNVKHSRIDDRNARHCIHDASGTTFIG
jgi:hypothetical protein